MRYRSILALIVLAAGASDALGQEEDVPPPAGAQEEFPLWKVSGVLSTDVNGLLAPSGSRDTMPEEGVVGEYSLTADLHVSQPIRVSMTACVGCHGFELQSAYADVDLLDGLTLRAGRIPVPFGGFSRTTGPAQMAATSKPLPYLMGMMVREREFNMGMVPAPFIDNGAAATANVWLSDDMQLGVEAAVVRGLKGGTAGFAFDLSRDFEDNNGEPAGAARVTLTAGPATLGVSGTAGHYDVDGDLAYRLASVEGRIRLGPLNLLAEGVVRETEFLTPSGSEDDSRRTAFVVQVEAELDPQWTVFARSDGLRVKDLFLTPAGPLPTPLPGSADDDNTILRWTGGAVFHLRPGVLLKGSAEYWEFSDFDDTWVFHFTFVVAF